MSIIFNANFFKTETFQLPLSTAFLPPFMSFLDGRNLSSSTILSYLSAISYVHKMKGLPDPTKAFLIQKLLTALSRPKLCDVRLSISILNGYCKTSLPLFRTPTLRKRTYSFLSHVPDRFLRLLSHWWIRSQEREFLYSDSIRFYTCRLPHTRR